MSTTEDVVTGAYPVVRRDGQAPVTAGWVSAADIERDGGRDIGDIGDVVDVTDGALADAVPHLVEPRGRRTDGPDPELLWEPDPRPTEILSRPASPGLNGNRAAPLDALPADHPLAGPSILSSRHGADDDGPRTQGWAADAGVVDDRAGSGADGTATWDVAGVGWDGVDRPVGADGGAWAGGGAEGGNATGAGPLVAGMAEAEVAGGGRGRVSGDGSDGPRRQGPRAAPLPKRWRNSIAAAIALAAVAVGVVASQLASPGTTKVGGPAFPLHTTGSAGSAASTQGASGDASAPAGADAGGRQPVTAPAKAAHPAGSARAVAGPPPGAPSLTVLNQTGQHGLAATEADRLRAAGWTVRRVTNVHALQPETTVFYDPGQESAARALIAEVPSVKVAALRPRWLLPTGGLIVVVARDAA